MNNMEGPIPIDLKTALERTGGETDFLEELIDMFMDDFEEQFAALKDAVHRNDAKSVQETAHSLKGSSANLGFLALQDTFFQLESAGRERDLIGAEHKIDLLRVHFDELKTYLHNR